MSVHMHMYKCVVWVWSPEADVRAHQISSAGLPVCPRGSPVSTSPQLELHLGTTSSFLMCVLGGIQLACSCVWQALCQQSLSSALHQLSFSLALCFWSLPFSIYFVLSYVYECLHMDMCTWVQVPMVTRSHQSPRAWSYRWLWEPVCGCWGMNSIVQALNHSPAPTLPTQCFPQLNCRIKA